MRKGFFGDPACFGQAGWFSPCLLLFAELNFVPAKESDAGAKPSGTEEIEQATIINSWQGNQQTLAVQTRLYTGSYSNHKTEREEEGASSIHLHV